MFLRMKLKTLWFFFDTTFFFNFMNTCMLKCMFSHHMNVGAKRYEKWGQIPWNSRYRCALLQGAGAGPGPLQLSL